MFLRNTCTVLVGLALAAPAFAATWADSMFDELSRDFGAVPRGPTVSHHFRIKNNTGKVVTIGKVRVSCDCTTAAALKNRLNPGEETAIFAQMDTIRFSGPKMVTIIVRFEDPKIEEVRLWVTANARDDLTISPDSIEFGQVKRGEVISKSVTITFLGGGQERIQDVTSDSNYVQPTVKEIKRTESTVEYQLTAKLRPDVPPGKWYTVLWMKTNTTSLSKISVPLMVEIVATLDLSPAFVQLGEVKVGAQTERRVMVRGNQPFKIKEIQGTDDQVLVQDTTDESKQLHVLIVTLKASRMGEINQTIKIVTDMKEGNEVELQARGKIITELKDSPRGPAPGKLFGRRKPPQEQ